MKKQILILLAIIGIIQVGQSAIVKTEQSSTTDWDSSLTSWSESLSANDLINNGQSTLSSVSATTPNFGAGGMNDGSSSHGNSVNNTFYFVPDESFPAVATYNLDTSVNTSGYDITSIDSFMGWWENRLHQANQTYTVEVSLVGSSDYSLLATVNYTPFDTDAYGYSPSGYHYSHVEIAEDSTGVLATGVDSIRFTFSAPVYESTEGAPGTVIREIDVHGSPTGGSEPAIKSAMNPVSVTGWDADIVIAVGESATTGATEVLDGAGAGSGACVYYERGFNTSAPSTGLATGLQTSETSSDLNFQLQSFTGNNAVYKGGTLTLTTAAAYDRIALIGATGNGTGDLTVTFKYTTGNDQVINLSGGIEQDWFNGGSIAYTANGRVSTVSGGFDFVNSGNPRLYETVFEVDETRLLESVVITDNNAGSTDPRPVVMAISGSSTWTATVTTQSATNIETTTATLNGNLTALGSPAATSYGFCVNTTGTPTIADLSDDKGAATATGVFSSNLTGLESSTTYYVRAYATNSVGTVYGNQIIFTTDVYTPAIGVEVVQNGVELIWTVENEISVKSYQIVDKNGKLLETVIADGCGSYYLTLESAEEVSLTVVDESGYSQSFKAEDGNIQTTVYDLVEGWNLIAVTSEDADLSEFGQVWAWSGNSYEAVESAEPTDAIWVYSETAKQVIVSGQKSAKTIKLQTGWNMVGPVENCKVPEEANAVYSWTDVYNEIADENAVLIEGVGYWIFSIVD